MDLFRDLHRLASADQSARRLALLALLREMDCPFTLSRECLAEHRPENIVIRFHEDAPQRVVLGAHYDSLPGSTGANDNGAGVCVLLAWLRGALHHPPPFPLDVVFFDLEERGQIGSRAYVTRATHEDLLAMINLDICGVGDILIVAPSLDVQESLVSQPLCKANRLARCAYRMIDALPAGDNLPFEEVGVPTLSVGMLPAEDVEPLLAAIEAGHRGRPPASMPTIAETFHNGCRDAIETIEASAMEAVLRWLESLLMEFSGLYGHTR